ncbi:dephospho-CoA kinase [Halocola ammonii]
MRIIGVTGGIGSGKTVVCKVFQSLGIPVYNADDRAKALYTESEELKSKVIKHFGGDVYKDGELQPQVLSKIVFDNQEKLELLNSLVHPAVAQDFKKWIEKQNASFVIREAAILIESGSYRDCDKIITVEAPEDVRISRVIKRNGVTEEDVRKRISRQMTDKERREFADFVIDNSGEKMLIPQVMEIYKKLKT